MPTLALAFNYWLHLLATIVWLGGMATLTLLVWPRIVQPGKEPEPAMVTLMDSLERRLTMLGNISLAMLIVTGLIQMGGNVRYKGFLVINSPWAAGLLAKHIVIGAMIVVSGVIQLRVYPELERARLLASRGDNTEHAARAHQLRARIRLLNAINLGLGVVVLMLTAFITAVPV